MNFLQNLIDLYSKNISNIFTVTGNISDIILVEQNNEISENKPSELLVQKFGENNHVVLYSPSRGFRYSSDYHKQEFFSYDKDLEQKHKLIFGLDYADSKYNIVSGLHHIKTLLEEYARLKKLKKDVKNLIIIIEDADIIFPNKPINQMGLDEKLIISSAREIFESSDFVSSNNMVVMLSKNFYALNEDIRDIPTLENIELNLPDQLERLRFIEYFSEKYHREFDQALIAEISLLSAGISLTNLKSILKEDSSSIKENISNEVSTIISRNMAGKVSVMETSHGYDAVIGYEKIKKELDKLKKRMFLSDKKLIWKGLMFTGPTGVGKDYILEAFIHEVHLPALKIGNLKSKWYGETLEIVEKLKRIVRSFGKVILVKTEADTMFADPENDNNHQTDRELMGVLLDWMGDDSDRGKIHWVFNTSRPQNLPTDFQRRVEIKIPILDLDGDDKWEFIKRMFDHFDIVVHNSEKDKFLDVTHGLSNSNLRDAIAEVAAERAISESPEDVNLSDVMQNVNFLIAEDARKEQTRHAVEYSTYKHLT